MSLLSTAVMAFIGAETYDVLRLVGAKLWNVIRVEIEAYRVHRKFKAALARPLVSHGELFDPILECCGKRASACQCVPEHNYVDPYCCK